MDFEASKRERDRKLRRKLLSVLNIARATSPTGRYGGESLMDEANDGLGFDRQIESERHAIGLLRYLVDAGYAEEHMLTRRRTETFGLRHVEFRITDKGARLLAEQIEPDPLIDDERIMGDDE